MVACCDIQWAIRYIGLEICVNLSNVRIVSDGTSYGTKVFVGEVEVQNVAGIVIEPITPKGLITATIMVNCPILDIKIETAKKVTL